MADLPSKAVVSSVGLTCKAFMNFGFCSITVNGLHHLVNALESDRRNNGQGVVTVCNHISTLDDPVTWGILPTRYYFNSRTTRWSLGASDILFTNPVFSAFFRLGQTLETFRGKGVYQPAVDTAIAKLDQGAWVHLYGEGKVNQTHTYPRDLEKNIIPKLHRFKWGVGRILMEAATPPVVIPMFVTGFDQLMPEGRRFPYKYFPRPGAHLTVTFGPPIPPDEIKNALGILKIGSTAGREDADCGASNLVPPEAKARGWIGSEVDRTLGEVKDPGLVKDEKKVRDEKERAEIMRVRSEVTAVVQRAVEALGRDVYEKARTSS